MDFRTAGLTWVRRRTVSYSSTLEIFVLPANLKKKKKKARFPSILLIKKVPANAGDTDIIPGSERFPGVGTHSCILVWIIPWTKDPGGL